MTIDEAVAEALHGLEPAAPCLVGVSGGCDSMVLLDALASSGMSRLVACHFDHGLRPGDARREASLVRRAAQRAGCAFEIGHGDVRALARRQRAGIEAAARSARHAFFAECGRRHGTRVLFLAHHLRDQAETLLFHLCRGSGLAGMAGIAPRARLGGLEVRRPFIEIPPSELRDRARMRKIRFLEDPSNQDPRFTRNRIRHRVVPALDRIFGPAWMAAAGRAAAIARHENELLESLTPAPGERLKVAALRALPLALRRRMVLRWLRERGVAEAGFLETERVLGLLEVRVAKVNLPGGAHARRRAGEIFHEPGEIRDSP